MIRRAPRGGGGPASAFATLRQVLRVIAPTARRRRRTQGAGLENQQSGRGPGMRQTALHEAAKEGHTDIAKQLLARDADVNARDIDGATPLIVAVEHGHREFAELLLAQRADLDAKNDGGQTALH